MALIKLKQIAGIGSDDTNLADSLTYNNDMAMQSDIGGCLASDHTEGFSDYTLKEVFDEILYPYVAPTVGTYTLAYTHNSSSKSLASTTATYLEADIATTLSTSNTSTIVVTKKSNSISTVTGQYITGNSSSSATPSTSYASLSSPTVSSSGTTLSLTPSSAISLTTTSKTFSRFRVAINDSKSTVYSSVYTLGFVYPIYMGTYEAADIASISGTDIAAFSGTTYGIVSAKGGSTGSTGKFLLNLSSSATKYFTTTASTCPVVALPTGTTLSSITDQNNFTQNWTSLGTVSVTLTSGTALNYNVYYGGAGAATGFGYTIKWS